MTNPFFSIIIPTYNRAELLRKTLLTFKNQEFSDFEVIVVDDGGNDHSEEVVAELNDNRFVYYWKENGERGAARNYGAERAKGKYVNFFDSDDLAYPDFLIIATEALQLFPKTEVFALGYDIKSEIGKRIKKVLPKSPTREHLYKGNYLSCNSVFVRRNVFLKHRFNEDRALSGSEDFELWLRLAARYDFPVLPKIGFSLIHHDNRSVFNFDPERLIMRKEKMLEYMFSDPKVIEVFRKHKKRMTADAWRYVSLHLVLNGHKKLAMKCFWKAAKESPMGVFNRTNMAILKRVLL